MSSSKLHHRKWSYTYDSHIPSSPSSSPPCSSSPATSPLLSTYSRPHIAPSSPDRVRGAEFDSYCLPSRWPPQFTLMDTKPAKAACKLPSFRSMFGDLAPSTSSDVDYSDSGEVEWEKPDVPSSALFDSVFYSDSEEEDNDEVDEPEALDSLGSRFQTSDERGRWKEPLPPSTSAFRQRHSEPTTSRPVAPPTKRTASEPVHYDLAFIPESRGTSYDADLESELQTDGGAMSSPDIRPYASLPPSSPPLSPKSLPASPDLGSLSAFSPLSASMSVSPSISSLALTPLSPAINPLPSDDADVDSMNLTSPDNEPVVPASAIAVAAIDPPESSEPITCSAEYKHGVIDKSLPSPGASVAELPEPLAITVKTDGDDVQMVESQCSVLTVKENDAKRRKSEEPPPRKKARTTASTSNTRKSKDTDENSAIAPKRRTRKPAPAPQPSKPAPRRRRRQPSFSSSSSDSDSEHEAPPPPIPKLVMSPEDLEICGMIIETMATSRASTHSASSLFKSVTTNRPALQREWSTVVFARVLEDAHGQNGIFGKVESSGMDDSDRPLEAQWFYVPERDEDQDRAALVRSLMPRPAKRSVTKKYKQYYYRPLGKISRWDDEDAL